MAPNVLILAGAGLNEKKKKKQTTSLSNIQLYKFQNVYYQDSQITLKKRFSPIELACEVVYVAVWQ